MYSRAIRDDSSWGEAAQKFKHRLRRLRAVIAGREIHERCIPIPLFLEVASGKQLWDDALVLANACEAWWKKNGRGLADVTLDMNCN